MATVTRYVNTASTPGGDGTTNATAGANRAYASLSEWESNEQTDLDTANDIMDVICEGSSADGTICTVDGWTTSPSDYIKIRVTSANRHDGKRNTSKYRIDTSTGFQMALWIKEDYVRVEGLQCKETGTNGVGIRVDTSGTDDIRLSDCLAYDCLSHGFFLNIGVDIQIMNCVALGNGGDGFHTGAGGSNISHLYNCVSLNNTGYGFFVRSFRTMNCKNCYAGGNTNDDYGDEGSGTVNLTTSHSEDATGNTTTAFSTSSGAYFTNVTAGSEDIHISTSSALKDVGTDLSADGFWTHPDGDVDIDGDARDSNWDVGADEFIAVAAGVEIFRRRIEGC